MILIYALFWIFTSSVLARVSDYSLPGSSPEMVLALRAQRDVGLNITIDGSTSLGVSLNSIIFEEIGYTLDSLYTVESFLNAGVRIFMIDLYWNEVSQRWQLCPGPLSPNVTDMSLTQNIDWNDQAYTCQGVFTFDVLMNSISQFITNTSTVYSANFFQLLINVKSINPSNYNYTNVKIPGNSSLSESVNVTGSYLYTPADLYLDRYGNLTFSTNGRSPTGYPLMQRFLFDEGKRFMPIVISNNLQDNTTYNINLDTNTVFMNGNHIDIDLISKYNSTCLETNLTINEIDMISKSSFRFVVDDDNDSFNDSNYHDFIHCGYTPIFNSSSSSSGISNDIDDSLWSWAPNQPEPPTSQLNTSADTTTISKQVANRCVVLYTDGWRVDNCYNKYRVACRKDTRAFEWVVSDDYNNYFDSDCPPGYVFGIPRSALQDSSLRQTMIDKDIPFPIWIDMNSITVANCWVSGGPYALCPYRKAKSRSNFVQMITPASVVTFIILLLIFFSRFRNVPIQSNRKHWKALLNDHPENDYEGVPS